MSTENRRATTVAAHANGTPAATQATAGDPRPRSFATAQAASDGGGWAHTAAGHAPLVLAGLGVALVGSVPLAEAWFVVSRLAYVGLVGFWLRAESKGVVRSESAETAWRRFRARAARLMVGDVVAFGALCLVTRGTFSVPGPQWLGVSASALLIALGVGIKIWATKSLDEGTFYWRDFFVPHEHSTRSASGPYRWMSNPMYTVGYAHAYGFALLLRSGPGLLAAAFAQLAITLLAALVERPHARRFRTPE